MKKEEINRAVLALESIAKSLATLAEEARRVDDEKKKLIQQRKSNHAN